MFKLWLLSANKLQLTWAELISFFSHQFSAGRLKLHRPWPLFILKRACCVKAFLNASHVCCSEQGVLVLCTGLRAVTNLGLWDRLLFEHTKTRHKWAKSVTLHMAASKAASFLIFPPTFSLSFFLFYFHPLLMCDTLILNILFPVFWSIGFTCRWVGDLHRLKGLPSLLMLSDNGVSIHPLC